MSSRHVAREPTVVILTGGHLCHNPRVLKEATALASAGYEVRVLGSWFDPILKARDRALLSGTRFGFEAVVDLTSPSGAERARFWYLRARAKATRMLCRWTGLQSTFQLGLTTSALYRNAANLDAALYIAHLEPTLPLAVALLRAGKRVGVDMEDWYSEDLLPEARKHRPVRLLGDLERHILQRAAYATCPSHAMSQALAAAYGCAAPTVIYNSFRWDDRISLDQLMEDRRDRRVPSIHWYSQTIGPGRGLEDLLAALPHLTRAAEIHLRGNPVSGFNSWLSSRVPERLRDRVIVHGLVSNERLLSRIAEHDIGFAGEMRFCRSRDLTVTNKMMEYLLAGLAVVASDTAGQREVAGQAPGAVFLYASGEPRALAAQLNALLASSDMLCRAKSAALRAAQQVFSWECQEPRFLETIASAIARPSHRHEVV